MNQLKRFFNYLTLLKCLKLKKINLNTQVFYYIKYN